MKEDTEPLDFIWFNLEKKVLEVVLNESTLIHFSIDLLNL